MRSSLLVGGLLGLVATLPFVWKWRLGVARTARWLFLFALTAGLLVFLVETFMTIGAVFGAALVWLLTLLFSLTALAWRFYRDPERDPPDRDDVVVSPADGEVIYVHESRGGLLPVARKHGNFYELEELTKTSLRSEDALVIGIALNFLDVHVNRAPVAGRVSLECHYPGRFGSLRRREMVFENERATIVIEHEGFEAAVVLIASRLVRRIITYGRENQQVALGQRIGAIKFGSQVDLVLPAREDLEVTVRPGDRVTAAESVVAVLHRHAHRTERAAVVSSAVDRSGQSTRQPASHRPRA